MRLAIESFRGEAPRVTPRALPDNAAQAAVNARLLTGDLTAWKQFLEVYGLANAGPVLSLSHIGPADTGAWMSWDTDVDVARGTTPGDTTFRTYLTGPDEYTEPRFTTLALATSGAQPYPTVTRPLGVPAPESPPTAVVGVDPNAVTGSVDVLDEGTTPGDWTFSTLQVVSGSNSSAGQYSGNGNPLPCYLITAQNNETEREAFGYRDFGVSAAAAVALTLDLGTEDANAISGINTTALTTDTEIVLANSVAGYGPRIRVVIDHSAPAPIQLSIGRGGGWEGTTSTAASAPTGTTFDATARPWLSVQLTLSNNTDGSSTITASVYAGSAQLTTLTYSGTFVIGDFCGFRVASSQGDDMRVLYDNFHVTASGISTYQPVNVATSYVYTFVNDLDQESAPSLPTATLLRPDGVAVTVTTPTTVPSGISLDYGIDAKRIYRAVTGSTGTAYQFVAEIPLATADYVDTLTDAELGETLESSLWALPPNDLRGILPLPNGVMAGFSKNQLCLSAQNHPHAWPVEYRLNTDTDIVAIGNVDNTVVIGTEAHVYVASGNDPAAYSMAKSEVPYACVSKRSLAYLTGIGVVFAGTDGVMAVVGIGQVRNLTESVFTLRQWQALNPSSITAIAHNDIYWMAYDTGTEKGCYAIDMRQTGFGVVRMAFHFTSAYVNPTTDVLYMTLDADDQPYATGLSAPSQVPVYLGGTTVYAFDSGAGLMTYRWRSKLWLTHPLSFAMAQVRAESYVSLLIRFYANGDLLHEQAVTSEEEFVLPLEDDYTEFEIEILGSDTVRSVRVGEDVLELLP